VALAGALGDIAVTVRLAAIDSLARIEVFEPIRERGLADADATVRLAAATRLLEAGDDRDYARLVVLLSVSRGGVASGVEGLLRDQRGEAYEQALVDGLRNAPDDGTAMRIVRLMCRRVDQDLGYDPGGDASERERVAARFAELVEGP
jgi:hypothetical protein